MQMPGGGTYPIAALELPRAPTWLWEKLKPKITGMASPASLKQGHTRPNKLPTHHCSSSQAPRLCGSSPSCSSKTDSSPVDTGKEQVTLSAWKQMLLPLF